MFGTLALNKRRIQQKDSVFVYSMNEFSKWIFRTELFFIKTVEALISKMAEFEKFSKTSNRVGALSKESNLRPICSQKVWITWMWNYVVFFPLLNSCFYEVWFLEN